MQKICDYIFKTELRVNPKDHPVMLTVSPLCSPESRLELAKLMFDVFAVPALCMASQAVLSLYSTGRTTGLVCELGEGMSYCVPIYEGYSLKHAVLSLPVAGADLTKYLLRNLADRGFSFLEDSQGDTVRDIKEKLCRVKANRFEHNIVPIPNSNAANAVAQASASAAAAASSADSGAASSSGVDETSYELPDGTMIRLDDHCRFNSLEILFAPDKYAQALGVHLTGGNNQSFGIPMQASSSSSSSLGGLASSSSGGGGGGLARSISSAGGGGGAGASGASTPLTIAPASGGQQQLQPPGSAGSMGSFSQSMFSSGGGARSGGPIQIDLSTNDLIGVHLMVYHSLAMCDAFLRKELLKNIVLAGGTSMAKGFGDRMKREIAALLGQEQGAAAAAAAEEAAAAATAAGADPSAAAAAAAAAAPAALNIITDSQRKYAAWIGASMYASLPTFNIIKITADQYKRDENVVHKKFF